MINADSDRRPKLIRVQSAVSVNTKSVYPSGKKRIRPFLQCYRPGGDNKVRTMKTTYDSGFTPGSASTRSTKDLPRISKFGYWSKDAQAGDKRTTGWSRPEASASRTADSIAVGIIPAIS